MAVSTPHSIFFICFVAVPCLCKNWPLHEPRQNIKLLFVILWVYIYKPILQRNCLCWVSFLYFYNKKVEVFKSVATDKQWRMRVLSLLLWVIRWTWNIIVLHSPLESTVSKNTFLPQNRKCVKLHQHVIKADSILGLSTVSKLNDFDTAFQDLWIIFVVGHDECFHRCFNYMKMEFFDNVIFQLISIWQFDSQLVPD